MKKFFVYTILNDVTTEDPDYLHPVRIYHIQTMNIGVGERTIYPLKSYLEATQFRVEIITHYVLKPLVKMEHLDKLLQPVLIPLSQSL